MAKKKERSIQELEAPVVKLDADVSLAEPDNKNERPMGREYPKSRHTMPERQLFEFAEYKAQEAERIGYSNYSYWKSVWANFLKKKSAVIMSIVFILLFIFMSSTAAVTSISNIVRRGKTFSRTSGTRP